MKNVVESAQDEEVYTRCRVDTSPANNTINPTRPSASLICAEACGRVIVSVRCFFASANVRVQNLEGRVVTDNFLLNFNLLMMKTLLLIFLFVLLPGSINGQNPPIGIIDFYGLRSLSEQQARQALQIKEGDSLPASREEAQRRLEALPNVQQALLGAVCCEAGKTILYIGIKEKGTLSLQFRAAPKDAIRLPETILRAGDAFYDALTEGILKGDAGEDDSQGHALNSYPKVRAIQEQFITFAAQDFELLRTVLRESADAQHRALAAQLIAYTANKGCWGVTEQKTRLSCSI